MATPQPQPDLVNKDAIVGLNTIAPMYLGKDNPSELNRVMVRHMTAAKENPALAFFGFMSELEPNGLSVKNYIQNGTGMNPPFFSIRKADKPKQRYTNFELALQEWQSFKKRVIESFVAHKGKTEELKSVMKLLPNIFSSEVLERIGGVVPAPAPAPPAPAPAPPAPAEVAASAASVHDPGGEVDGQYTDLYRSTLNSPKLNLNRLTFSSYGLEIQKIIVSGETPHDLEDRYKNLMVVLAQALYVGMGILYNEPDPVSVVAELKKQPTPHAMLVYIARRIPIQDSIKKGERGKRFLQSPDRRLIIDVINLNNTWADITPTQYHDKIDLPVGDKIQTPEDTLLLF